MAGDDLKEGNTIYQRYVNWSKSKLDDRGHELTLKCWQSRPWMVSAYTGRVADDRDLEMCEWCRDKFGPEAWPIHDKDGEWYRGGATVYGWTHFGFKRKDQLDQFKAAWPPPDEAIAERERLGMGKIDE